MLNCTYMDRSFKIGRHKVLHSVYIRANVRTLLLAAKLPTTHNVYNGSKIQVKISFSNLAKNIWVIHLHVLCVFKSVPLFLLTFFHLTTQSSQLYVTLFSWACTHAIFDYIIPIWSSYDVLMEMFISWWCVFFFYLFASSYYLSLALLSLVLIHLCILSTYNVYVSTQFHFYVDKLMNKIWI